MTFCHDTTMYHTCSECNKDNQLPDDIADVRAYTQESHRNDHAQMSPFENISTPPDATLDAKQSLLECHQGHASPSALFLPQCSCRKQVLAAMQALNERSFGIIPSIDQGRLEAGEYNCEILFRNSWFEIIFPWTLTTLFFVGIGLSGFLRYTKWKICAILLNYIVSCLFRGSSTEGPNGLTVSGS